MRWRHGRQRFRPFTFRGHLSGRSSCSRRQLLPRSSAEWNSSRARRKVRPKFWSVRHQSPAARRKSPPSAAQRPRRISPTQQQRLREHPQFCTKKRRLRPERKRRSLNGRPLSMRRTQQPRRRRPPLLTLQRTKTPRVRRVHDAEPLGGDAKLQRRHQLRVSDSRGRTRAPQPKERAAAKSNASKPSIVFRGDAPPFVQHMGQGRSKGLERSQRANWKHGRFSQEARQRAADERARQIARPQHRSERAKYWPSVPGLLTKNTLRREVGY
jgi:hypothetical protein